MAETTISDLYEKYTNQVGEALEDDRYFQYLFEMVQAGDNTLEQKNRILHKVIDEQWLTVVEEGIEAIFNIVDKPRRFIATSEEVVPVALAKKITADSVRHLSQHTQFITENAAGEIQPTRILNVTTEESYDLYENRFVYHLIQRLFAFVDKRTDDGRISSITSNGAHAMLSRAVLIPRSLAALRRSLANSGWQRLSPPERVRPPPERR